MANNKKCPICGREGIGDYLKEDVTCPDCGSNLKAFRLINQLEQDANSKTSNWKPFGIVAMVAALIFALLYFTKGSMPTADKERLSVLEDSIATLNEMIKDGGSMALAKNTTVAAPIDKENKEPRQKETAKTEEQKTESTSNTAATTEKTNEEAKETLASNNGITAPNDMVTVRNGKKYYTVKKGDSWWKICGKLYNHKISDDELAKMNGKNKNNPIDVGQEILVK